MGRGMKKVISGQKIFGEEDEKISTTTCHAQSSVDNEQLPAGVKYDIDETIEKATKKLTQKDVQYQPTSCKPAGGLQAAKEELRRKISEKEKHCRALASDKNRLQTEVSKLNDGIQAISTEFQAASKAWQLEKGELLSQIVAARKEFDEMSIENERALLQYREEKAELECGLNDSKARCQELLDKFVEEKHQWDSEKANLEGNLELMGAERGLLNHQNRELRTEVESLKAQFNESNAAVAQLEDQLSSLAAAKMLVEEENNSLHTEMDRRTLVSEEEVVILKRKVGELETALGSLQNDLDFSIATTMEKDRNIVDLEYKVKEITDAKKLLEQKNSLLLNDENKRRIALQGENEGLQLKIRELETNLHSATMDLESKNVELSGLKTKRPLFPPKPHSPPNGKGNGLREKPKPIAMIENLSPNTTKVITAKAEVEKRTPPNRVPVKRSPKEPAPQKRSPNESVPQKRSPKESVPQKPSPKEAAPQKRSPQESVPQKPSPKEAAPQKRSPKESVPQRLKPKWL